MNARFKLTLTDEQGTLIETYPVDVVPTDTGIDISGIGVYDHIARTGLLDEICADMRATIILETMKEGDR